MYYFGRTLLLFCRPTQQASVGAFPVAEEGEEEYQNIPNKAINRENFAANWVKSIPHLQPIHIRSFPFHPNFHRRSNFVN